MIYIRETKLSLTSFRLSAMVVILVSKSVISLGAGAGVAIEASSITSMLSFTISDSIYLNRSALIEIDFLQFSYLSFRSISSQRLISPTYCRWKLEASGLRSTN